ncbi:MAG: Uncharacterized protein XD78_0578 [Desulfotomaculum sp. 46_296]|nr:MAG: Uncharacterized protein XD78_0578 [Desulfotomaculum sp. 46_296]HAG08009.1 hypothetical protein [Desulfotomaculum sp.]HAU31559.1 hypothetical protein [Desulfotomaculum sp.]
MKFGSNDWANAFKDAVNNDAAFFKGLADPASFTYNMELAASDNKFHISFVSGKVTWAGEPKFKDEDLTFVIVADSDTWKKIASGQEQATKMLAMGKVKMLKGPVDAAIKNAGAFNSFLAAAGKVPTEY